MKAAKLLLLRPSIGAQRRRSFPKTLKIPYHNRITRDTFFRDPARLSEKYFEKPHIPCDIIPAIKDWSIIIAIENTRMIRYFSDTMKKLMRDKIWKFNKIIISQWYQLRYHIVSSTCNYNDQIIGRSLVSRNDVAFHHCRKVNINRSFRRFTNTRYVFGYHIDTTTQWSMIAIDNSCAKTENLSCSRISDRSTYIVHPRNNNKCNDVNRMYNINVISILFIINEKLFLSPSTWRVTLPLRVYLNFE